jgi:selenide,water dikinase
MGPADLHVIMRHIPPQVAERLLVGTESFDDAAVYDMGGDQALVQTVDFFTPIVDDPFDFGAIAAANALSDIYAMGAKPLLALNIACFPRALGEEILGEVVRGGAFKVNEAGAVVAGGHTVEDDDLKFGLAVTGVVDKNRIITNTKGAAGDILYITKAIGTGCISTAVKSGECSRDAEEAARLSMLMLNEKASSAMVAAGAKAATDITGFGFLGHLFELASGSKLTAEVWADAIPLLQGALELSKKGFLPGGAARNRSYLHPYITIEQGIPLHLLGLLFDPQTSGGLLIAIPEEMAGQLEAQLRSRDCMCRPVGRLLPYDGSTIRAKMSKGAD